MRRSSPALGVAAGGPCRGPLTVHNSTHEGKNQLEDFTYHKRFHTLFIEDIYFSIYKICIIIYIYLVFLLFLQAQKVQLRNRLNRFPSAPALQTGKGLSWQLDSGENDHVPTPTAGSPGWEGRLRGVNPLALNYC